MSKALNFTPQAIESLRATPYPGMPITKAASAWIVSLLERAQVFQLPENGHLLDRGSQRPEMPASIFRPPFDVVACETLMTREQRVRDQYTATPCTRRISLAWDWRLADLPTPFSLFPALREIPAGVAILSVMYVDAHRKWVFNPAATLIPYEAQYHEAGTFEMSPFIRSRIGSGDMPKWIDKVSAIETGFIPISPELLSVAEQQTGSRDAAIDIAKADNHDEVVSYVDMCFALGCRNVQAERHTAPQILNRERRRKRRPELRDFHILTLDGEALGVASAGSGDGKRSHLRRSHIRRLGGDRLTWVNQTMVHGRTAGFVDKTYRMRGQP